MGGWKYEWGLVGNVCLVLMLWKLFVILLLGNVWFFKKLFINGEEVILFWF